MSAVCGAVRRMNIDGGLSIKVEPEDEEEEEGYSEEKQPVYATRGRLTMTLRMKPQQLSPNSSSSPSSSSAPSSGASSLQVSPNSCPNIVPPKATPVVSRQKRKKRKRRKRRRNREYEVFKMEGVKEEEEEDDDKTTDDEVSFKGDEEEEDEELPQPPMPKKSRMLEQQQHHQKRPAKRLKLRMGDETLSSIQLFG